MGTLLLIVAVVILTLVFDKEIKGALSKVLDVIKKLLLN